MYDYKLWNNDAKAWLWKDLMIYWPSVWGGWLARVGIWSSHSKNKQKSAELIAGLWAGRWRCYPKGAPVKMFTSDRPVMKVTHYLWICFSSDPDTHDKAGGIDLVCRPYSHTYVHIHALYTYSPRAVYAHQSELHSQTGSQGTLRPFTEHISATGHIPNRL